MSHTSECPFATWVHRCEVQTNDSLNHTSTARLTIAISYCKEWVKKWQKLYNSEMTWGYNHESQLKRGYNLLIAGKTCAKQLWDHSPTGLGPVIESFLPGGAFQLCFLISLDVSEISINSATSAIPTTSGPARSELRAQLHRFNGPVAWSTRHGSPVNWSFFGAVKLATMKGRFWNLLMTIQGHPGAMGVFMQGRFLCKSMTIQGLKERYSDFLVLLIPTQWQLFGHLCSIPFVLFSLLAFTNQ